MRSKIEKHPDRAAIEQALARRVPLRKMEKRFGVTISALRHHHKKIMRDRPEMFLALQAKDWKVSPEQLEKLRFETSAGWLANVRAELGKVMHYRERCAADGDDAMASAWTVHVRKYLDMLGHAAEQLKSHSVNIQNNFFGSPDYYLIQACILQALAGHPAARADVIRALEQMERGPNAAQPPMITVSAPPAMAAA